MRGNLPNSAGRSACRNALMIERLEDRVALSATPATVSVPGASAPGEVVAEHAPVIALQFGPWAPAELHALPDTLVRDAFPGPLTLAAESRFESLPAATIAERSEIVAAARFERSDAMVTSAAAPFVINASLTKADLSFHSDISQALFTSSDNGSMNNSERFLSLANIDGGARQLGADSLRGWQVQIGHGELSYDFHFQPGLVRLDAVDWRDVSGLHHTVVAPFDRDGSDAGFDRGGRPARLDQLVGLTLAGDADGGRLSDGDLHAATIVTGHSQAVAPAPCATIANLVTSVYGGGIGGTLRTGFQGELEVVDPQLLRGSDVNRNRVAAVPGTPKESGDTGYFDSVRWYAGEFQEAYRTIHYVVSVSSQPGAMLLAGLPSDLEAVDEALSAMMSELDRLGGDVGTWLDDLPVKSSLAVGSAIATLGLGAWHQSRRRSQESLEQETERESSSWLFVRLHSSAG